MASTRTVYVICDANCKWEGMTKEQILTAIVQAVEGGAITDVDTGFVRTIRTINGQPLRFFVGEQSEYDALTDEEKHGLFAIITNDTTKEGILEAVEEALEKANALERGLLGGSIVPKNSHSVNGLQITRDINGVLKIGTTIIPQKFTLWTGTANITLDGTVGSVVIDLGAANIVGKTLEVECCFIDNADDTPEESAHFFAKFSAVPKVDLLGNAIDAPFLVVAAKNDALNDDLEMIYVQTITANYVRFGAKGCNAAILGIWEIIE